MREAKYGINPIISNHRKLSTQRVGSGHLHLEEFDESSKDGYPDYTLQI